MDSKPKGVSCNCNLNGQRFDDAHSLDVSPFEHLWDALGGCIRPTLLTKFAQLWQENGMCVALLQQTVEIIFVCFMFKGALRSVLPSGSSFLLCSHS